ncbi:MAG: DUF4153 domain-containing protein [bacterium]
MKLPSIQYLAGEALASFRRFPLAMTAAIVAAVCGIIATEVDDEAPFVRVMVTAQLAIPLFFALVVAAESNRWPLSLRSAVNVVAVAALVGYHSTLPDHINPGVATRFLQLNVGLHLLAAFLPFARGGNHNGFWQYNRRLFLRFLTAVLYSAVVYLGLSLALLALDQLLGLPLPENVYLWLLIATLFVFNTWVFLGGVPRDIEGLESVTDYPGALKVFAQYILIPLVVIYLAILTIYLVKVIVTAVWPSGWIGWMVSSVAVVGILALLLVWPVANRAENRWVATYTRWFFIFMLPAIVMLLLAVYKRIDQYGITENRYFLAVLSVWLAAVAVYFIVSRARRIKMIPVTLYMVAFATSFGPWGAYTVSRRSQTARLERLMEANGILVDGVIVKTTTEVPLDDRREISAISYYLVSYHGAKTFDRWLDVGAIEPPDSVVRYGRDQDVTRSIVAAMGLEYVESWARAPGREGRFNYGIDRSAQVFELEGADYMVRLNSNTEACDVGDTGLIVAWEDSVGVVLRDSAGVVAVAPVDSVFARIKRDLVLNERAIPADVMRVSAESARARLTVYFTQLNGETRGSEPAVDYVNADCFVTVK